MATRDDPFGAFNFLVNLGGAGDEDTVAGGFSEVSGLATEIRYAEYRNGNDKVNHPRLIPTLNRTHDVVLRRGLIGDLRLFAWLKATRDGDVTPQTVTITLLDQRRAPVCQWRLLRAQPKKWVGPTLAANAGTAVAMEELRLVAEQIDFVSE